MTRLLDQASRPFSGQINKPPKTTHIGEQQKELGVACLSDRYQDFLDDYIEKRIHDPQALCIENLRQIARESLRQNKIDDNIAWRELKKGRAVLERIYQLDKYLWSYGQMTDTQWEHLKDLIQDWWGSPDTLQVIDYGCGQGLSALKVGQILSGVWSKDSVRDNVAMLLIEKSIPALRRAKKLSTAFFDGALIKQHEICINQLRTEHLLSDVAERYLHVFSNVLDIEGIEHICVVQEILRLPGQHMIVAVSNDRDTSGGTPKLKQVYKSLSPPDLEQFINTNGSSVHLTFKRSLEHNFRFPNSNGGYWRAYAFAVGWDHHTKG